jgi:hypothetical protein
VAGRIRSIKPEILDDEKTAALSHLSWRLFVSLWLIADDYGNLRGDAGYIQGQALWASNETRDTVAAALDALAAELLIARYTVRGQSYYHICGWDKHQKVDKPGKPRMPGPDESDTPSSQQVTAARETFAESSRESLESLATDLRPPTSDLDTDRESPRAHAIQQSTKHTPPPPPPVLPRSAMPNAAEVARLEAIGDLARQTWRRLSELRMQHATKLKLERVIPFDEITPGNQPAAFDELRQRIREAGSNAQAVCEHVLAHLDEQATDTKSIDWLAEKAFLEGPWRTARNAVLKPKRKQAPTTPKAAPEDRGGPAGAAELSQLREVLGWSKPEARAGPASQPPTYRDEQQPEPKAAT